MDAVYLFSDRLVGVAWIGFSDWLVGWLVGWLVFVFHVSIVFANMLRKIHVSLENNTWL